MARQPVKSLDRMLTRRKFILSALLALAASQQHLRELIMEDDGPRYHDGAGHDEWHGRHRRILTSMLQQCAVLSSAIAPGLRPKTRYTIGSEKWSFERIERQFVSSERRRVRLHDKCFARSTSNTSGRRRWRSP